MKQRVILSTTMVYPSHTHPMRGVFVQRRLAAMHAIRPVKVVSPQPWFPVLRPANLHLSTLQPEMPPVVRQPMFYFPGVLKDMDARFYANALRAGIAQIESESEISCIDAHFEWPDMVGTSMIAREKNLPFVCTLRGKLCSKDRGPYQRREMAAAIDGAAGVIAVSQSLADAARTLSGRRRDIHVIPNGIDSTVFRRFECDRETAGASELRRLLGWDASARYVVSVGHIQRLKGFHRLVEIWPTVCRGAGDVRLVLIGGEAGEAAYSRRLRHLIRNVNRQIDNSGNFEAVELVGAMAQDRVATLLNAADLFALASSSEGWCNAISESLACGCPVVATNVGGNSEIVTGPELGRLVELDDSTGLANAIIGALSTNWDRNAIAQHGGGRSWNTVAAECIDVVDAAISHFERRSRMFA